ncbi:zinc finger protein RFP-like isoform 2-T2 [Cyanocitta cristata]
MKSYFSQGPERKPKKTIVPEGLKRVGNPGKGSSSPQLSSRDRRDVPPQAVGIPRKLCENTFGIIFKKAMGIPRMLYEKTFGIVFKKAMGIPRKLCENTFGIIFKKAMGIPRMLYEKTFGIVFKKAMGIPRMLYEKTFGIVFKKARRTVEENIRRFLAFIFKKDFQEVSQQIQTLQETFQQELQMIRENLHDELELFKVLQYKGDVTLDPDTAHPRLEISADGQKVKDTGVIRQVPSNEKRFDSHLFVLAKEGYTSGKHYWEVSVGRRRSWALGIAWESVTRKGPLTLCPQNGFWAIGLADGRDYWAYTDQWTRLNVSGHLHKIGIFLNIPAKQVTFYHADKGAALHTFSIGDGSSQERKFIPFFSTGPVTAEPDPEPLLIA